MKQIVGGIIVICFGLALILFKKKIIDEVVDLNNNQGLGFYKYGDRERNIMRITVPLSGALVIILGILIITSIFDLK